MIELRCNDRIMASSNDPDVLIEILNKLKSMNNLDMPCLVTVTNKDNDKHTGLLKEYSDGYYTFVNLLCQLWNIDDEPFSRHIADSYIIDVKVSNKEEIDKYNFQLASSASLIYDTETKTFKDWIGKKDKDFYYYIDPTMEIKMVMHKDSDTDMKLHKVHNYFFSQHQAEKVVERLRQVLSE